MCTPENTRSVAKITELFKVADEGLIDLFENTSLKMYFDRKKLIHFN